MSFHRLPPIMGEAAARRLRATVEDARVALRARVVWHVNSTRTGGGVAEMLQTQLGYECGAGIDARWLVIEGGPEFFRLTKCIHHRLHGKIGDGARLGEREHKLYAEVSRWNARQLLSVIRPRDMVILHDPQTAGLAPALRRAGALVVWRCHIGSDTVNRATRSGWAFLERYLVDHADAFVFSRARYVPKQLASAPVSIIPPAIDSLSLKNAPISRERVRAVLEHVGLLAGQSRRALLRFRRPDGSPGRVERRACIVQTGPVPSWTVPIVAQVSRWDPLKDMTGVMRGFVERLAGLRGGHLLLVGPDVGGVADDPEAEAVLQKCTVQWQRLPEVARQRIHLVCLPIDDIDENAVMVNAIQRHARIVVQKSVREGFGLTVTEAMVKGRPVVASAVGGIQDQIVHGVHGLLLEDPNDRSAFGDLLVRLLRDTALARRLGRNARRRAITRFLGPTQLMRFADLLCTLQRRRAA